MSPVARPASGQVYCRGVRYVFGTLPIAMGAAGRTWIAQRRGGVFGSGDQ